jgi:hypothetical protein
VFLRLTCRSSQDAAYFAAVKAKDGTLYATAKSADIQKQVGLQSGAYTAAIIVGDTRATQPLLWTLGEVQVLHAPLDDGSQPAAASYRAIDRMHKPLPEIVHMHRLPERRAPAVVSVLFTLVAAAPVAIYVAVALQMGANLKVWRCASVWQPTAATHEAACLIALVDLPPLAAAQCMLPAREQLQQGPAMHHRHPWPSLALAPASC